MRSAVRWVAVCVCCWLGLGAGTPAAADTEVGGLIVQDTLWDLQGSPYIISSQVVVGGDAVLTIEAGVEVLFEEGLSVLVGSTTFGGATIIARGTNDSPIIFTSVAQEPAPGDWGQLVLGDRLTDAVLDPDTGEYLSGSIMEHCYIGFGGGFGAETGFRVFLCAPVLNNLTIFDMDKQGVLLYPPNGINMHLRNWRVIRCGDGTARGGGMNIGGSEGQHVLEGCIFEDNAGDWGGAVFAGPEGTTYRDCRFARNTAGPFGGAFYCSDRYQFFENCLFDRNTCEREGGAVWSDDGSIRFTDCVFFENGAIGGIAEGGAIYVDGGGVEIERCEFRNNRAVATSSHAFGGAVMLWGTGVTSRIESCLFENNSVYAEGSQAYGGALGASSVPLFRSAFLGNSATGGNANAKAFGGAVWFNSNDAFEYNSFENNTTAGLNAGGGAVLQEGLGTRYVGNSFVGNTTTGSGGAMYLTRRCSLAWDPDSHDTNRFLSNVASRGADIYNNVPYEANGSNDIDASYVCWGTDDINAIGSRIYDFLDDGSKSVVGFLPVAACSGGCIADWNGDQWVNTQDFIAFLGDWSAGFARADVDDNGVINSADFIFFLRVWAAGC